MQILIGLRMEIYHHISIKNYFLDTHEPKLGTITEKKKKKDESEK